MLFRETAAVYCENQKVWDLNNIYKYSPYLTENTLGHRYTAQPVNAVWGKSRCFLWEAYAI
jgi:hypothetical protein